MDSYFEDIEFHIIDQIRNSQNRLLIAVAWFTNEQIGQAIIGKQKIDIEVVVDDNPQNRNCSNIITLQRSNIDIHFVEGLSAYYRMHNKFCVIDNHTTITGSYNWTKNANNNDENITVIKDSLTAALYTHEFRRIKERDFTSESVIITEQEHEEIIKCIYDDLVALLKTEKPQGQLKKGIIVAYNNERVKNKIRRYNEQIRNTLQSKISSRFIYLELIRKYGWDYESRATTKEKIKAKDTFKKKGLDTLGEEIDLQFRRLKLLALNNLILNYSNLLKVQDEDSDKIVRIMSMIQFLAKERSVIASIK